MTRLRSVALILVLLVISSCKKKEFNALLIVNVFYNEKPVANPTVYIKYGGKHNPHIPLSQYDDKVDGDDGGHAYFTDLPEDDYFLYATANPTGSLMVVGTASASLAKKEAPNRYEKRITLN